MSNEDIRFTTSGLPAGVTIQDILDAMSQDGGYLDITPSDALALYKLAYRHAAGRLGGQTPIRDIMTTTVVSVPADMPVSQVARTMAEAQVTGLPVLIDGKVAGIISIKDFLPHLNLPRNAAPMDLVASILEVSACGLDNARNLTARDLMTSPVLSVSPGDPASIAAGTMREANVNRLLVMQGEELAGIVTRNDIIRSLKGAACTECA